MAQKRIKMARYDSLSDKFLFLYDDGSQGGISLENARGLTTEALPILVRPDDLIGLTLKQAKIKLRIKN